MSNDDNINSTINPTNGDLVRMSLLTVADDDDKDDPGDYNKFRSDYDLADDSVFDNDKADNGEGYVCMTVSDFWLSLEKDEYKDGDIQLHPVYLMSMAIQAFILISSMAFSTIALVAHTSMVIPFPTPKYFVTPCSNSR